MFDMRILHAWASQQLKQFKSLQRLFSAMDPDGTDACSLRDTKYVFSVVYGRFPSEEQQQTVFKAFKGTPLRDAASKVAGTHERFRCASLDSVDRLSLRTAPTSADEGEGGKSRNRKLDCEKNPTQLWFLEASLTFCRYKAFLDAIKPALVLLLHEKRLQETAVLPRDASSCPLYVMCNIAEQTLPGVGVLRRALLESGEGFKRMGRLLLDFAAFKSVARTVLTESEEDVDVLLKACRAVGSKSVDVDTVLQLLCICLERSLVHIMAGRL